MFENSREDTCKVEGLRCTALLKKRHGCFPVNFAKFLTHFSPVSFVIVDTSFEHRVNILGKIYLLIADTILLVGKKENTCIFLFDTFLYFNMKLIFPMLFFSHML